MIFFSEKFFSFLVSLNLKCRGSVSRPSLIKYNWLKVTSSPSDKNSYARCLLNDSQVWSIILNAWEEYCNGNAIYMCMTTNLRNSVKRKYYTYNKTDQLKQTDKAGNVCARKWLEGTLSKISALRWPIEVHNAVLLLSTEPFLSAQSSKPYDVYNG